MPSAASWRADAADRAPRRPHCRTPASPTSRAAWSKRCARSALTLDRDVVGPPDGLVRHRGVRRDPRTARRRGCWSAWMADGPILARRNRLRGARAGRRCTWPTPCCAERRSARPGTPAVTRSSAPPAIMASRLAWPPGARRRRNRGGRARSIRRSSPSGARIVTAPGFVTRTSSSCQPSRFTPSGV